MFEELPEFGENAGAGLLRKFYKVVIFIGISHFRIISNFSKNQKNIKNGDRHLKDSASPSFFKTGGSNVQQHHHISFETSKSSNPARIFDASGLCLLF